MQRWPLSKSKREAELLLKEQLPQTLATNALILCQEYLSWYEYEECFHTKGGVIEMYPDAKTVTSRVSVDCFISPGKPVEIDMVCAHFETEPGATICSISPPSRAHISRDWMMATIHAATSSLHDDHKVLGTVSFEFLTMGESTYATGLSVGLVPERTGLKHFATEIFKSASSNSEPLLGSFSSPMTMAFTLMFSQPGAALLHDDFIAQVLKLNGLLPDPMASEGLCVLPLAVESDRYGICAVKPDKLGAIELLSKGLTTFAMEFSVDEIQHDVQPLLQGAAAFAEQDSS